MSRNLMRIKGLLLATLMVVLTTGCGSTSGDKSEVLNTPNEVQEMNVVSEQNEPEQDTEQDDLTDNEKSRI